MSRTRPGDSPPAASEEALEETLSRPTAADVDSVLSGALVILGVAGKMGPSLARLARRAADAAGIERRIVGVARFSTPGVRDRLEQAGVETIACDLLDRRAWEPLPDAAQVVLMAGQKFGTEGDAPLTWAINTWLPVLAAERYREAPIVAFSTGNVYPLVPVTSGGARESDPVGPIGEYAQSALARERLLEFCSRRSATPMTMLRLNYAIEPRYGVLRDVADRVFQRQSIDLTMGHVNVIWQRDANSVALRSFAHCATPPLVLNVTGRESVPVRWLARRFGDHLGIEPSFEGVEGETALLSDASRCHALFGAPKTTLEEMITRVAEWVARGGRSLGKPTRFEERGGRF